MNGPSDENLVLASRGGDRDAYALLVRRHFKHVFIVCMGIVGNVADAEDAAQETVLKGFTEIGKLQDSSQFGPWITKIAKNHCINLVRRKQRTERMVAKNATKQNGRPGQHDGLQIAIEQLPLEMRLPLVMYYLDGKSVKAVAEKLKISTSGVYLKLRTAVKELQRLLAEQGDTNG